MPRVSLTLLTEGVVKDKEVKEETTVMKGQEKETWVEREGVDMGKYQDLGL